jgi:zinc transporter ZupT
MENLGASLGWGLVIGGSLVLGAVSAAILRLPGRVAATLTAFGGGVLLAAIALELVPEADREAGAALTAAGLRLDEFFTDGGDLFGLAFASRG